MPERVVLPPKDSDLYPIANGLNSPDLNTVAISASQEAIRAAQTVVQTRESHRNHEPLTRLFAHFFWYLRSVHPVEQKTSSEVAMNIRTLLTVQSGIYPLPLAPASEVPIEFWKNFVLASNLKKGSIIYPYWRTRIGTAVSFLNQAEKPEFPHAEWLEIMMHGFSDFGRLD